MHSMRYKYNMYRICKYNINHKDVLIRDCLIMKALQSLLVLAYTIFG